MCVVVRRPLVATMSSYLVDRIVNHPRVKVHEGMTITSFAGAPTLERITVSNGDARQEVEVDCTALFSFIGAEPNSSWLDGVAVDEHGFVLTDRALERTRSVKRGVRWDGARCRTRRAGLGCSPSAISGRARSNGSPLPSVKDQRRSVRCTSTLP